MELMDRMKTYQEFWPYYLREHSKPVTRGLHFFGTSFGVLMAIGLVSSGAWPWVLTALIPGYAFSWIGHFFVEKNRPATFQYPGWSFISDFKMLGCLLTGKLGAELERAGVPLSASPSSAARRSG
jgi:hypothetical protein